ncbi:MAG: M48 family metalloprotease [Phycisphaerales bacterium]
MMLSVRNVALVVGLFAWLLTGSGCVKNAATGDRFFSLYGGNRQAEIALGAQAAPGMANEFGGAVASPALQAFVRDIGSRLAAVTEADNPGLPWEFTLLDSAVINAFALPGGKVYITRGLCERMSNEAQLAGVLGHEVGHVTAQHTMRRIGQQQLVTAGVVASSVAVAAADREGGTAQTIVPALSIGGSLVLLKFGRDEESQADTLGMRYMSRIGYNPRGQLQVMEILRDASGGSRQIEFLATHPLPETRIQRVSAQLAGEFKPAVDDPNNQLHEERFQRQFLAALRQLPPPTQTSEARVEALMRLAQVCGPACGHAH